MSDSVYSSNQTGNVAVSAFESEIIELIHGVFPSACLIGAAGCAVLTVIVSLISLKRISGFKLSDINK